jgi:hypothetical protein
MPGNDLPTVLLMETLRVGASILMVAGVALVAGAVLTETTTDTSKLQKDPYAGSLSLSHARALSFSSTHFLSPILSLPPCLCHSRTARTHSLTHTLTFVSIPPQTQLRLRRGRRPRQRSGAGKHTNVDHLSCDSGMAARDRPPRPAVSTAYLRHGGCCRQHQADN